MGLFRAIYPSVDAFAIQSNKSEVIIDSRGSGCLFSIITGQQGFEINNPYSRPFNLVKIDGYLLPASKGGQCDGCFIYNDGLGLLELKIDTTTPKKKNAKKHYKKAERQLLNTVLRFDNAGLDIRTIASNVEADVCVNNSFPRTKSSEMSSSIRFAIATKGIGLYFTNSKTI